MMGHVVPLLSAECIQPVEINCPRHTMLARVAGLSSSMTAVCWTFDFAAFIECFDWNPQLSAPARSVELPARADRSMRPVRGRNPWGLDCRLRILQTGSATQGRS